MRGTGGLRGGTIDARGDHRMAMMGAVAGLASREGVEVLGMEAAAVSYPRLRRGPGRRDLVLVAIDGPGGAGKSTVARALARELGFTYLDSGAMYRCVALLSLARPAARDPRGSSRARARDRARARARDGRRVLLDGADVTERDPRAARSRRRPRAWRADPGVRAALVAKQRALIAHGRLGRRGPRHRHRRRAGRRAEGLPDGRARASARAAAPPSSGADPATVLAEQALRDERDSHARAQPAARRPPEP